MSTMSDNVSSNLNLKRKRTHELTNDSSINGFRRGKRLNLTGLPLRESSLCPPEDYPWQLPQHHVPGFSQPLTPVDSSDDEACGQAESAWTQQHKTRSSTPGIVTHRLSSATVDVKEAHDDMVINRYSNSFVLPSLPTRNSTRCGHAELLSAPAIPFNDRMPTPITDRFNVSGDRSKSRTWRSSDSSMLSPVFGEDTSLLSPVESIAATMSMDPETLTRMEHTSNDLGALSVTCNDDEAMTDDDNVSSIPNQQAQSISTKNIPRGNSGRRARMHMGFRADCEKCQQRVPGHYSHIIWS